MDSQPRRLLVSFAAQHDCARAHFACRVRHAHRRTLIKESAVNSTVAPVPTPTTPTAAPHPRAGQSMSGAEIIVQVLVDEGVDTIFGYSGGAILPTYDAVFRWNQEQSGPDGKPMPLI